MSFVRFAAWGSVDVESMERMQRRKYLKSIRQELAAYEIAIDIGGQRNNPHYILRYKEVDGEEKTFAVQGRTALLQVLQKAAALLPTEVPAAEE